jgi:hypothetical protein
MAQFSNWDNNKLIVKSHHDDLLHSAQADQPWRNETDKAPFAHRIPALGLLANLLGLLLVLLRR